MIPDINLLPKYDRQSNTHKVFYIVLAIIATLILLVLVWLYFMARGQVTNLSKEQTALQAEQQLVEQELATLQLQTADTIAESLAFIQRVSYPVSPLIDELNNYLPDNTYLRNYSFAESGVEVRIDFETLAQVSTYIDQLENSAYFTDVQLGGLASFDVVAGLDVEQETIDFDKKLRYTTSIVMLLDHLFLATGGVEQ